jgi:hypothetical protein
VIKRLMEIFRRPIFTYGKKSRWPAPSGRGRRLEKNYRNTIEIAKFAAPLIMGLPEDDDFTIPDLM